MVILSHSQSLDTHLAAGRSTMRTNTYAVDGGIVRATFGSICMYICIRMCAYVCVSTYMHPFVCVTTLIPRPSMSDRTCHMRKMSSGVYHRPLPLCCHFWNCYYNARMGSAEALSSGTQQN